MAQLNQAAGAPSITKTRFGNWGPTRYIRGMRSEAPAPQEDC